MLGARSPIDSARLRGTRICSSRGGPRPVPVQRRRARSNSTSQLGPARSMPTAQPTASNAPRRTKLAGVFGKAIFAATEDAKSRVHQSFDTSSRRFPQPVAAVPRVIPSSNTPGAPPAQHRSREGSPSSTDRTMDCDSSKTRWMSSFPIFPSSQSVMKPR